MQLKIKRRSWVYKCFAVAAVCYTVFATRSASAAATPSMTWQFAVQPQTTIAWQDQFDGIPGVQPTNWWDATQAPGPTGVCAEITYSYTPSYAAVTLTADAAGWGQVFSPHITCDVTAYPMVFINVTRLSPGAHWLLGVQENGGSGYADIKASSTDTGTFSINYNTVMNGLWSGGTGNTHDFSLRIVVQGSSGAYIEMDEIRVNQ